MTNINIQKVNAIKVMGIRRLFTGFLHFIFSYFFIIVGIFLIYHAGCYFDCSKFNFFNFFWIFVSLMSTIIYQFIQYLNKKEIINSLVYEIDEMDGVLINSWKNLLGVKNKDSSRLQVVNNVNIKQTFLDKLFNLYSVEVEYGFSSGGYVHTFNYLSEEDAENVVKKIKSKANTTVKLK